MKAWPLEVGTGALIGMVAVVAFFRTERGMLQRQTHLENRLEELTAARDALDAMLDSGNGAGSAVTTVSSQLTLRKAIAQLGSDLPPSCRKVLECTDLPAAGGLVTAARQEMGTQIRATGSELASLRRITQPPVA